MDEVRQRTLQQNKAIHKYCSLLAKEFNDAGLDMKAVLKPEVEIPWSGDSVKEYLWRPIQKYLLQKESSTELQTDEVSKVYDVVNRLIGEKHGLHVPFPEDTSRIDSLVHDSQNPA